VLWRELLSGFWRKHDPGAPGLVADLAAGTGHYLSGVLEALPHRHGVCLDLSVPALRRAARSHPRAAAVGADIWQPLPLATRSVALALSIFGPRNAAETGRVLGPGGALIMAMPGPAHLWELRRPLGMIGIDKQKLRRIAGTAALRNDADRLPVRAASKPAAGCCD
jgi:23S rRNA (guanine745-N1)-methyltransferase